MGHIWPLSNRHNWTRLQMRKLSKTWTMNFTVHIKDPKVVISGSKCVGYYLCMDLLSPYKVLRSMIEAIYHSRGAGVSIVSLTLIDDFAPHLRKMHTRKSSQPFVSRTPRYVVTSAAQLCQRFSAVNLVLSVRNPQRPVSVVRVHIRA